jgi:antirestriction protein ArdC
VAFKNASAVASRSTAFCTGAVILLWGEAMEKGYENPVWMSFKQAKDLGGSVRKGEHGTMVVFADKFTKKVS